MNTLYFFTYWLERQNANLADTPSLCRTESSTPSLLLYHTLFMVPKWNNDTVCGKRCLISEFSRLCVYVKFSKIKFSSRPKRRSRKSRTKFGYDWSIRISQPFAIYQFSRSLILCISSFFYMLKWMDLVLLVPPPCEVVASVALMVGNQWKTTHIPLGETNLDVKVPPHPNVILLPPQIELFKRRDMEFRLPYSLSNLRRDIVSVFSKRT